MVLKRRENLEKNEKFYCYVPHSQSKIFEDLGWEFASDLGPPHAAYASLYIWGKEGEPVHPSVNIEVNKKTERKIND